LEEGRKIENVMRKKYKELQDECQKMKIEATLESEEFERI